MKLRLIKSDEVVIKRSEYEKLLEESRMLKVVLDRIRKALTRKKK